MVNRKTLTALALIACGMSAPVLADDADIPRARILLEEARNFGVSQPAGQAAGEVDAQRERERRAANAKSNAKSNAKLNANEKLWQATSRHRSGN